MKLIENTKVIPSWRSLETYWGTKWESLEKADVIQETEVNCKKKKSAFIQLCKQNNYICFVVF